MQKPAPSIVVIDADPLRSAILLDGLRDGGFAQLTHISDTSNLLAKLHDLDPDVILIDLENPSRDVLEAMFQVSRLVERPVAMFVDQTDAATTEAAIDAGVSAYIVDGLKRERVKAILEMTISRFNAVAKLRAELAASRTELADHKAIDAAKHILMKNRGMSEPEAYALLRATAMARRGKLVDVARALVASADLLLGTGHG